MHHYLDIGRGLMTLLTNKQDGKGLRQKRGKELKGLEKLRKRRGTCFYKKEWRKKEGRTIRQRNKRNGTAIREKGGKNINGIKE
jgi:hypothetical protein